MNDPLNRYMRGSDRLAALRLCVSHPFCAETIRDSCNSSLQLVAKRSHWVNKKRQATMNTLSSSPLQFPISVCVATRAPIQQTKSIAARDSKSVTKAHGSR